MLTGFFILFTLGTLGLLITAVSEAVMEVKRMSSVDPRMGVSRADRAPHPSQRENAEQDQHDRKRN